MDDVKRRSFAAGYLLGLAGLPVAAAPVQFDSEPTMCLYGDTPLPYLQWDKKMYPKALVTYDDELLEFKLVIYRKADYYQVEAPTPGGTYTQHWFGSEEENTALVFSCKAGDTSWSQMDETSYGVYLSRYSAVEVRFCEQVIWANFYLMFDDGTLYVSASEPEPIEDANGFDGKSYFNHVVLPHRSTNIGDDYYEVIMRRENFKDEYIMFVVRGFHVRSDSAGIRVRTSGNLYLAGAYICKTGDDTWRSVGINSLVETEYDANDSYPKYVLGKYENLIWTADGITDTTLYNKPGSEPVPVVIPESTPGAVNDNKLFALGCRLGYIIRSQMAEAR